MKCYEIEFSATIKDNYSRVISISGTEFVEHNANALDTLKLKFMEALEKQRLIWYKHLQEQREKEKAE